MDIIKVILLAYTGITIADQILVLAPKDDDWNYDKNGADWDFKNCNQT